MITRKSLADEIDTYDQSIADLNQGKKDCFDAYREQMVAAGVAKENVRKEIDAVKAAIRRRRAVEKDEIAVEEKDALVDEVFAEITAKTRAPARAHVIIEEFPAPPPPGAQGGEPGEPSSEAGGEEREGVDAPTQERAAVEAVASSAHSERAADQFEPVAFLRQAKPIRPHCLHPGDSCGGYGSKHCNPCLKAAGEVAA